MKKLYSLLFLLCACSIALYAQKDAATKKMLDEATAKLNKAGGVEASFSATNFNGSGKMNGTISFKGNKYRINTTNLQVWFDGKTQWSYNPDNSEVNITTPTLSEQQSLNPYAFINLYRNGYNYTSQYNNIKINNKMTRCPVVHLKAERKEQRLSELYITLNPETKLPVSVRVRQGNNWTTIQITRLKTNQKWNDTYFRFNPKQYPNAEIIDLR